MPSADYLEGVRLFNEGRYWDAHEAWERIWVRLPKGAAERRFCQGLILLAAAFLHRERARSAPERSAKPAVRCYRSGMEKLEGLPDVYVELDLVAIRREAAACFEPVAAGAPEAEWPAAPRLAAGHGR